jgi:general secretion pathway protein A
MITFKPANQTLAYLDHFGLTQNPFPVAPDDANFYLSRDIEEIIAEIVHGICARKGFILLTGDVGLGKTTITRRILKILESRHVSTSLVFHTSLKDVDLLREINRDFGLPVDAKNENDQLGDQLQRLNDFLVAQYGRGRNCAIIIDDAQNLDRASLELVRMISNLEVDQQKIVQIVLVGQSELMTTLKSRSMRQLYSRIVIRKVVQSLSRRELQRYIQFKLNTAGNQGCITLSAFAYRKLFGLSKGNFRSVNLLMDRCLYAISLGGEYRIKHGTVIAAIDDLNPEKKRWMKRFVALTASVMVPAAIALGSWMAHLHTSRKVLAHKPMPAAVAKVPQRSDITPASTPDSNPTDKQIAPKQPQGGAIDPAIRSFLSVYQLDRYGKAFHRAIEKGTLDTLALRIYGQTGYQLIKLLSVPEHIRKQYGVLAFTVNRNPSPEWLLFWRPQLELRRFHQNYRGEEIYKLQQRLHNLHYYRYNLDGIVGQRLMNAVISFQKQTGLPATGFPDPVTLFWVYHQQEGVFNG